MTLHKHENGNIIEADETNKDNAEAYSIAGLNLIRMLIDRDIDFSAGNFDWWGDAYVSATGREDSVDTGIFTSAEFDTNKYKVPSIGTTYIVIEATSVSNGWTSNDTKLIQVDTGKWILYYTGSSSDEVARAQIHKSLWYGTNGSNQLIEDFVSVTAIKTNDARDVGKKGFYYFLQAAQNDDDNYYSINSIGTFTGTSGNNVSSWSMVDGHGAHEGDITYWAIPNGTVRNSSQRDPVDELGTDKNADEYNNPLTFKIRCNAESYVSVAVAKVYAIKKSESSFTRVITIEANSGGDGITTEVMKDFYTDYSIPALTAITTDDIMYFIIHTIPSGTFSSTISKAIGVPFVADWETGADIQYKLTGTSGAEDTGWLDAGISPEISSFTAFTAEPDTMIVKLVPKDTAPTIGTPSIKGMAIRAT